MLLLLSQNKSGKRVITANGHHKTQAPLLLFMARRGKVVSFLELFIPLCVKRFREFKKVS